MLTNLFYYDYYRPYIFRNQKIGSKYEAITEKVKENKRIRDNDSSNLGYLSNNIEDDDYSFYLNKALKEEVVNYASSISKGFNSIKDSAKDIFADINKRTYDFEASKEDISEGFDNFAKEYNSYWKFAKQNSENSLSLVSYAQSLKYRVDMDYSDLSSVGFMYDDEKLIFNSQKLLNMNSEQFDKFKNGINHFFDSVYKDTCEIMTVPMSEHMNFKNLNLYYNYVYSKDNSDTIKIIESGMIVDISL